MNLNYNPTYNHNQSVEKYQMLLDKFQKILQNQINQDQINFNKDFKNLKKSSKNISKNSNSLMFIIIIIFLIATIIVIIYYFLKIKNEKNIIDQNNKITSDPQKLLYIQENMLPQGTKVMLKNIKFNENYNKYANSFDGATGVISWEKNDLVKVELSTTPNTAGHFIFDEPVTTYDQKQWSALPNILYKYIEEI
jgi:predicted PurR-regulated permease PerM